MKTVLALIDHPNLDRIIVPVIVKLRERGVQVKALIAKAGRTEICQKEKVPYNTDTNTVNEFLNLKGEKLFLNAADQHFAAHSLGRNLDEICRNHNIPSFTVEHSSFAMAGTIWSLKEEILFDADKMAVIGEADYDAYTQLGVSPDRLVLTGFPPYDEYFDFIRNRPFKKGNYIYFAGRNHPYISNSPYHYDTNSWTAFLKHIYEVLLKVFPDLDILVKPHPAEYFHNTAALYEHAVSNEFRSRIRIADPRDSNIEGIFNSAFVVSFSPSVVLESILLHKNAFGISSAQIMPPGLLDAERHGIRFLKTTVPAIVSDVSDKLLTMMRVNGDRLRERVDACDEFMEKYFYKFDGKSSERVADAIISMMERSTSQIGGSLMNLSKKRSVFKDIGFERYQRLMGIAEETGLEEMAGYTLLDIGSFDGMFRRFVPEAEYCSFEGFITGNQRTPYQDNAFDVVVAADVLEHVPEEDREAFLRELVRIARKKVVFSFPGENSEGVENFILTILPDNKWLQEHRANTLPKTEDVNAILDRLGLTYQVKPNHSLASWVLSVLFDNMNIDVAVRHDINSFMQEQFYNTENKDPAYRYIYTVSLHSDVTPEIASKFLNNQMFEKTNHLKIESVISEKNFDISPDISIIVPVFNKVEYTKQCLESLKITINHELNYEVIVVDNASNDGTGKYLKGLSAAITIISNESNEGFAKACNKGARIARGKYLVFLNNDTVPQTGWLESLRKGAEHDSADICGAKLLYPDGRTQHAGVAFETNGIGYHIFKNFPSDAPAVNKKRFMQCVTGACMLISKTVFEELGGFDESYLNGFEDVDLCLRAGTLGKKILYIPESVLIHFEETSEGRKTHDERNLGLYLSRWRGKVASDDEYFYREEGFFKNRAANGNFIIEPINPESEIRHDTSRTKTMAIPELEILCAKYQRNPYDRENTINLILGLKHAGYLDEANRIISIHLRKHPGDSGVISLIS